MKTGKLQIVVLSAVLSALLIAACAHEGNEEAPYETLYDSTKYDSSEYGLTEDETSEIITDTSQSDSESQPPETDAPQNCEWNAYIRQPYTADCTEMIRALLNGEDCVSFSSVEEMNDVCGSLLLNFPPAALLTLTLKEKKKTVSVDYGKSKEAFSESVGAFAEKTAKIIEMCRSADNELDTIKSLYTYVASNVGYYYKFETGDYDPYYTTCFSAIMDNKTICTGYAGAYAYLLNQCGVCAFFVTADYRNEGEYHGWTMFEYLGQWYHADTTWEHGTSGGKEFIYFGMSDGIRFSPPGVLYNCRAGAGSYAITEIPPAPEDLQNLLFEAEQL